MSLTIEMKLRMQFNKKIIQLTWWSNSGFRSSPRTYLLQMMSKQVRASDFKRVKIKILHESTF